MGWTGGDGRGHSRYGGEGIILVNGEEGDAESEEARVPGAESP